MTMDRINSQHGHKWLMAFSKESFIEEEKTNLIYLSPDAEETMKTFEEDKIYIIGGIADHNSLKGATLKKSQEHKITAQKFPIDDYVQMKTAPVLSINQSFNILLQMYNGKSWEETLKEVIPKRKLEEN